MKKMSYHDLKELFRQHEADNPNTHLTGYIVFRSDNWPDRDYSLESRTYVISSENKAYMPNMGGYSVFGSAIDGSDYGVRLDRFMAEEHGGSDGWKVDYCYMEG